MGKFFKKLGAVASGRIKCINDICSPVSIDLMFKMEKLPMPYSLIFYHLMIQSYGEFMDCFTEGIYSHTLKKLDREQVKKVIGVYLCYTIWMFTTAEKVVKDFESMFSNFSCDEMYSILFKLIPDTKGIKNKIDLILNRGAIPGGSIPHDIEDIIGEKANDIMVRSTYGPMYYRLLGFTLDNIISDLKAGKTGQVV